VRARYVEGARAIAPHGVAAAAFGVSFGVIARTAGMGRAAPLVMSATTFAGSAIGVALGDAVGDPNRLGLDAAFPALFLALLVPQLRTQRAVVAAALGAGIALTLISFTLRAPLLVVIVAAAVAAALVRLL
jgi:predicted branched-subunit amino acid permease